MMQSFNSITDGYVDNRRHSQSIERQSRLAISPSERSHKKSPVKEPTPEERVNQKIKDVEAAKAMMFLIAGRNHAQNYSQTALIDES